MGDPSRMPILRAFLEEVKREKLLLLVQETGKVLLSGLKELQVGTKFNQSQAPKYWREFDFIDPFSVIVYWNFLSH